MKYNLKTASTILAVLLSLFITAVGLDLISWHSYTANLVGLLILMSEVAAVVLYGKNYFKKRGQYVQ